MNAHITSPSSHQAGSLLSSTQGPSARNTAPPQPAQIKTQSTDVFLKDFTLVAEAAKRAQMAVLMREMESCGLS